MFVRVNASASAAAVALIRRQKTPPRSTFDAAVVDTHERRDDLPLSTQSQQRDVRGTRGIGRRSNVDGRERVPFVATLAFTAAAAAAAPWQSTHLADCAVKSPLTRFRVKPHRNAVVSTFYRQTVRFGPP